MTSITFIVMAAVFAVAAPAAAWHAGGHQMAARQAVAAIDANDMPAFFFAGAGMIAHCAIEPDNFTRPIGPPELHDAEAAEHFYDVERLAGLTAPALRYEYLAMCYKNGLDPRKIGLLPYAVTEWTQRLAVALAEHRKWPDNPFIQQKALMYAGFLAHYAADLCQPLHTTVDYDGRSRADGSSPKSGIHMKVDALLAKLTVDANARPAGVVPRAFDAIMPAVMAELAASYALVERVYGLEGQIPAYEAALDANSPAADFARERLRACAGLIGSLYLTAWRQSQTISLPEWHRREPGREVTTRPKE